MFYKVAEEGDLLSTSFTTEKLFIDFRILSVIGFTFNILTGRLRLILV